MRRWVLALGAILTAFGVAELTARFGLGLGDPPLTVLDPDIEYLFAPGTYQRFGNEIRYNSVHMRADEPPTAGADAGLRVLVLGDSVINGGALTDHADLATTRLQDHLRAAHGAGWVGHVSAGSWGPANLLAYVERFGWFDADLAVIVLNGGDLEDLPEHREKLGTDFPTARPTLALSELVIRYLPRYLPPLRAVVDAEASPPTRTYADPAAAGREALEGLLDAAVAHVPTIVVLLHPGRGAAPDPDRWRRFEAVFEPFGVTALAMDDVLRAHPEAYRDNIHINASGQAIYAATLTCLVDHAGAHRVLEPCVEPAAR